MWCPLHTSTASNTAASCFPSLSVTTSHCPLLAKSGRLDTRHTLVWAQGERCQAPRAPRSRCRLPLGPPALTLKRMWRSRSKCWAYMRKYSMILELCM